MDENQARGLAKEHLKTEREAHSAVCAELGGQKCWQISFMGDGSEPVIVTINDESQQVLQVFEPLKVAPMEMRDLITGDTEKINPQD